MSAAVLISDNASWKPTIIRLVPFSNGKLSVSAQKLHVSNSHRVENEKRNYPILAVTRSNSSVSTDRTPSLTSPGSEVTEETLRQNSVPLYANVILKTVNNFTEPSDSCEINKPHVGQNCDTKDSAQDISGTDQGLNSGIDSNMDTQSSELSIDMVDKSSSILSKPALSERKYFYGANSSIRNIKPTPGELDLQKHKDNYAREQAQKRKKYKLNVNQLPRSTTPINDHDPDKLNMKQVIQFLQNKNGTKTATPKTPGKIEIGGDTQKLLITSRTNNDVSTNYNGNRDIIRPHSDPPYGDLNSVYKQEVDPRIIKRTSTNSRDSSGSMSVMSIKSVPVCESRNSKPHSKKGNSSKSMIDRYDRGRHNRRSIKEFKLYRFLALAPNGMGQTTTPPESTPNEVDHESNEKIKEKRKHKMPSDSLMNGPHLTYRSPMIREPVPAQQFNESKIHGNGIGAKQEKYPNQSERQKFNRTANIVHHRALMQQRGKLRYSADFEEENSELSKAIRLPSVHDFADSILQYDSDDNNGDNLCGTNILMNAHLWKEVGHEKEDLQILSSRSDQTYNRSDQTYNRSDQSYHRSDQTYNRSDQTYYRSDQTNNRSDQGRVNNHPAVVIHRNFIDGNNNKNRKLLVNMPNEDDVDSKEVIKLMLRQEKHVTPERSYMHDIASPKDPSMYAMTYQTQSVRTPPSLVDFAYDKRNGFRISPVARHPRDVHEIIPEETPLVVNEALANSCIKVRQKLKGAIYSE